MSGRNNNWRNPNVLFLELLFVCCAMAGEVCLYSYRTEQIERTAYVYCPTACCGTHGGFICCVKGSYYKHFNKNQRQYRINDDTRQSPEAIAAVVTGSLVGFCVFIGIVVVLYYDYTRKLIWFKQKTCVRSDEVPSENGILIVSQEEGNHEPSAPEDIDIFAFSSENMKSATAGILTSTGKDNSKWNERFLETDFL